MKQIGIIGDRDTYPRNYNYYNAIEACGVRTVPLIIGEDPTNVETLDGLILPGGGDVDPSFYGEENENCKEIDTELDRYELELIDVAVKNKVAILGICRGHQLLNVYFGGTLFQDAPGSEHHIWMDKDHDNVHLSRLYKDSYLYDIYGKEEISVNSAHHQAIKTLGKELKAIQYSDDGLIEAVIHNELPVYGVQWHPERMCLANVRKDTVDGLELFRYFVRSLY